MVGSWFIYSWMLLALQVKVGKVASFVGKIFVVQCSTTKTTNKYFAPQKLPSIIMLELDLELLPAILSDYVAVLIVG